MRKILVCIVIITILFTVFLIHNHNQLPTKSDVINITKNWSPAPEKVYLVKRIDGEWLTIFRSIDLVMIARLEQNWLGFWDFSDDIGGEATLASSYYPPAQDDEFTWSASGSVEGKPTYYFGQIINPTITEIKVETQKNSYQNAILINPEEARFFFLKSEEGLDLPINIRGFSDSGKLIYSTFKED